MLSDVSMPDLLKERKMLCAGVHPCAVTRYYPPTFHHFLQVEILVTRDEMQGVF